MKNKTILITLAMILFLIVACQQTQQNRATNTLPSTNSSTQTSNQIFSTTVAIPSPSHRKTLVQTLIPSVLPLRTTTPTQIIFRRATSSPTPSITSIPSITPQPGYKIWTEGSRPGYYEVKYPEDEWLVEHGQLMHRTLQGCFIREHGGSDICMSGGCVESGIILGDAGFTKISVRQYLIIYVSEAVRVYIGYEVVLGDEASQCMREAEMVLGTLKLRPERGCSDRAAFVADVTIPDDTVIPAGAEFTKTWRIRNIGTCTWNQEYSLFLVKTTVNRDSYYRKPLSDEVQPQETVDLSVELTAPSVPGMARWEWMLQNELEDMFGVGQRPYEHVPGQPFWVQIMVVSTSTP